MTTATAAPAGVGLLALPGLLREADGWGEVTSALLAGRSGTIDGAWGSSAALAAAALAVDAPGSLLVVLPLTADAGPWAADVASFTGMRPAVFEAWERGPRRPTRGRSTRPRRRGCGC